MAAQEKIGLKGILTIEVYENDTLVNTIKDENTIVDDAFDILFSGLSGGSNSEITKIALGEGGIYNSAIKTVAPNEVELYDKVIEQPIDTITSEKSSKTITFSTIVRFNPGQSFVLSEAGLFTANNTMFNRKCFSEFIVNEFFYLNIKWDIVFTFNTFDTCNTVSP